MKQKIIPPRKMPLVEPEKVWPVLHAAFTDILQLKHAQWSYSQLYNTAYNLVLAKHAQFLYNGIENEIKEHLQNDIRPVVLKLVNELNADSSVLDQGKMLQELKSIWDDYLLSVQLISYVALYLDRTYVKENQMLLIYDLGLHSFREVIIDSSCSSTNDRSDAAAPTIGDQFVKLVLSYYNKARMGELVDKFLLKSLINIFESLTDNEGTTYYRKQFEPYFLLDSHKYYVNKAQQMLNPSTGDSTLGTLYISNTLAFISHETSLQTLHIPIETIPTLQNLLFTDLILTPMPEVLSLPLDGLADWVNNEDIETLHDCWTLLGKVQEKHQLLKQPLRNLIIDLGAELIRSSWENVDDLDDSATSGNIKIKFASKIITRIVQLKTKFQRIIDQSFNSDGEINREIDGAFSTVVNESDFENSDVLSKSSRKSRKSDNSSAEGRFQEYLSLYIDFKIKASEPSDSHLDHELDAAVNLLRYVKDKDIFEKYYRGHLARRLLGVTSRSSSKKKSGTITDDDLDLEISMITKLQSENGSAFTSSLEGMVKDLKSSKNLDCEFNDLIGTETGNLIEFNPTLLTTVYWPTQPMDISDVSFPSEMRDIRVKFEDWYNTKHPGRKVRWCNVGNVVLAIKSVVTSKSKIDGSTKLKIKSIDVQMPPLCACILMLCFNDEEESMQITVEEIHQRTGIDMPDLLRHLCGLMSGRTKLISSVERSLNANEKNSDLVLKMETLLKANTNWKCKESKAKVIVPSNLPKNVITDDANRARLVSSDTLSIPTHLESFNEHSKTIETVHTERSHHIDAAIVRIMKSRKELKHQELILEVTRLVKTRFDAKVAFIKERIGELIELEYLGRVEDGYKYLA